MSDDLDIAADRAEMERAFAQTLRKPAGPVATGRCLSCDEITDEDRRWCDADCRDAWEALRKHNRQRF